MLKPSNNAYASGIVVSIKIGAKPKQRHHLKIKLHAAKNKSNEW